MLNATIGRVITDLGYLSYAKASKHQTQMAS